MQFMKHINPSHVTNEIYLLETGLSFVCDLKESTFICSAITYWGDSFQFSGNLMYKLP